jgi:hypothetical protein
MATLEHGAASVTSPFTDFAVAAPAVRGALAAVRATVGNLDCRVRLDEGTPRIQGVPNLSLRVPKRHTKKISAIGDRAALAGA